MVWKSCIKTIQSLQYKSSKMGSNSKRLYSVINCALNEMVTKPGPICTRTTKDTSISTGFFPNHSLRRCFSTSSFLQERSNYSPSFYYDMSSKHLADGSKCPPLQDGKLRIYSMRFCPFAQRAILVALAKEIPHDVVNCHLMNKADWLLVRNPNGKVPVIELADGRIIYESLIVSEYLDEVYRKRPLSPLDPFLKAVDKIWIEEFAKVIKLFYKILFAYRAGESEALADRLNDLVSLMRRFEIELLRRGTTFFGGKDHPGMLDYMIWPWIERLPVMKVIIPKDLIDFDLVKKNHQKLETWRQAMKEDFAVKEFVLPTEVHKEFIFGFLNKNISYDILEAKL